MLGTQALSILGFETGSLKQKLTNPARQAGRQPAPKRHRPLLPQGWDYKYSSPHRLLCDWGSNQILMLAQQMLARLDLLSHSTFALNDC